MSDKGTSRGTNDQGNNWNTPGGTNSSRGDSYHYSNQDGSYYYKNDNGSSYYNPGKGSGGYYKASADSKPVYKPSKK